MCVSACVSANVVSILMRHTALRTSDIICHSRRYPTYLPPIPNKCSVCCSKLCVCVCVCVCVSVCPQTLYQYSYGIRGTQNDRYNISLVGRPTPAVIIHISLLYHVPRSYIIPLLLLIRLHCYKIIKSKRSGDGAQQHLQRSVQAVMPAG